MTLSITGAEAAAQALGGVWEAIGGACASGLSSGLEKTAADAKKLCPHKTGALRSSIKAEVSSTGAGAEGTVSAGAPYAILVELGIGGRKPQPFLYPAFAANKDSIKAAIADAIGGAIG